MKVAVMGCVVNGPGESKHANHRHLAARHVRGAGRAGVRGWQACHARCAATHIVAEFIDILNKYVESHYTALAPALV